MTPSPKVVPVGLNVEASFLCGLFAADRLHAGTCKECHLITLCFLLHSATHITLQLARMAPVQVDGVWHHGLQIDVVE